MFSLVANVVQDVFCYTHEAMTGVQDWDHMGSIHRNVLRDLNAMLPPPCWQVALQEVCLPLALTSATVPGADQFN